MNEEELESSFFVGGDRHSRFNKGWRAVIGKMPP